MHIKHNISDLFVSSANIIFRRSKPVQGWGISAELSHVFGSEHHKSSAGAVCTQRQTRHDACRSRHGYLRRNHARLISPGDQLRRTKPVQGWGISAELSHVLGSEHHKSSAGAVCTQRQTRHDACRSRHGYLRRNHARLISPGDQLRRSKRARVGYPRRLCS